MDKTPVATKNRASLDTSADASNGLPSLLLHTFSPKRNGYSNVYDFVTPFSTILSFTSKLTVVYRAHIANI